MPVIPRTVMRVTSVTFVLVAAAVVGHAALHGQINGKGAAPDRYCLCHAATGCDLASTCTGPGSQGSADLCGPFHMSRPFWQDSNVTAIERFRQFDFQHCAADIECAAAAVTSYMTQLSRDCDGDGRVTCRDYGLMHFLGYAACLSPAERQRAASSTFHGAFVQCLSDMDALLTAGAMQNLLPGCRSDSV
ncbi:uncharacterized protein LOC122365709 [Amphibalanus amphitrite]|uniref:uncharacterized protein LOC122365709 n=1 Tax=Amphibalanus amphitrite TaxID=1232801 RepID=UPI001C912509|nr:uncharacterized protein LOC122365709 [Amphibalanus amphitrite]